MHVGKATPLDFSSTVPLAPPAAPPLPAAPLVLKACAHSVSISASENSQTSAMAAPGTSFDSAPCSAFCAVVPAAR